jgi:hypothetical protein
MKTISRIAIGAAVVLLVAATVQPSNAACSARFLDNVGAKLVSNPNWGGAGGTRTCYYVYGCYADDPNGGLQSPPISANFDGVFWGFDTAGGGSQSDPAPLAGMDNGEWGIENWSKQVTADFGASGLYHYPAFLTLPGGPNGTSGNPANWSFPVDGCPDDIDPNACTCILLTDQWDGAGYFFIDSANADGIGNFNFNGFPTDGVETTMKLAPTPIPEVVMSERDPASGDVTMMINVGGLGAADYRDAGCDCGLGYVVYQQIVGRGGMAPIDRSIRAGGWIPAPASTGTAQPVNAFGTQASIKVDCDPAVQQDLYLATALVDVNGYRTDNVSGNSFRIECGANLAEPNRPDRDRGRSADAPRGRDNNRGQRER